jgi:hypothetical protein
MFVCSYVCSVATRVTNEAAVAGDDQQAILKPVLRAVRFSVSQPLVLSLSLSRNGSSSALHTTTRRLQQHLSPCQCRPRDPCTASRPPVSLDSRHVGKEPFWNETSALARADSLNSMVDLLLECRRDTLLSGGSHSKF